MAIMSHVPAPLENQEDCRDGVTTSLRSVTNILNLSIYLIGITLLMKWAGVKLFQWQNIAFSNVAFSMKSAPFFIFLALSAAHALSAYWLIVAVCKLRRVATDEECARVFAAVSLKGGPFMRTIVPRTKVRSVALLLKPEKKRQKGLGTFICWVRTYRVYEMQLKDASTWVALAATVLLPLVIIPGDLLSLALVSGNLVYLLLFSVFWAGTLFLIAVNWVIGTAWAVALSELTVEEKRRRFLKSGWPTRSALHSCYRKHRKYFPVIAGCSISPLVGGLLLGSVSTGILAHVVALLLLCFGLVVLFLFLFLFLHSFLLRV